MEQIIQGVKDTRNIFLDILFPKMCFGCGKEGKYICEKCSTFVSEAALICPVCEKASFFGESHTICQARYGLNGLIGIWEYDGVIKKMLFQVKYKGVAHALEECLENAFAAMTKDEQRFQPFFRFLLSGDIYVAYVPMYKKKEKQRGFNQAKFIARELEKISGAPTVSLLQKIKDTKSQTELNRVERLQNIKDSFAVKEKRDVPRNVLLVDDIWTSGATMRECCKVLKKVGVENVWGFALARTV